MLTLWLDGVSYDADTVETEDITVNKEYHGVRVSVVARLDTARQRISMDIGFGDVVTPAPQALTFPALIDTRATGRDHGLLSGDRCC